MGRERTTISDLRYARQALGSILTVIQDYRPLAAIESIPKIVNTALEEIAEQTVPFHRADGRTVCTGCLSIYREHPLDRRQAALSDQGLPFLRVLCSGERVKL